MGINKNNDKTLSREHWDIPINHLNDKDKIDSEEKEGGTTMVIWISTKMTVLDAKTTVVGE